MGEPPKPFIKKDGSDPRGWNKGLTKLTNVSVAKSANTLKLLYSNGLVPKRKSGVVMLGGYREVMTPEHPLARKGKYVYEHTLVAEEKIGRFLEKGEVVHHLDENKQNNDPGNLIVFKTTGDHTRFHRKKKENDQTGLQEVEPGVYICKKDYNNCTVCGKVIRTHKTGLCKECYNLSGKQLTIKNLPGYKKLLEEINQGETYQTLANKYNTSYQTIRSRIRKMI